MGDLGRRVGAAASLGRTSRGQCMTPLGRANAASPSNKPCPRIADCLMEEETQSSAEEQKCKVLG